MAELIVMVCLLATPEKCQEYMVPDAGAGDVVTCIRAAAANSEDWQELNNKYFVIGWRCAKDPKVPEAPSAQ